MPKRRVLALAVAAVTVAASGGAASASALSHGGAGSGHAPRPAVAGLNMPGMAQHAAPRGRGCGFTKAVPFDRYKGLPNYTKKRGAQPYLALMYTTQGLIVVQALTANAPCTAYSFRFLAERDYFTGTHCHRLTTMGIFVLQCGDPTGTGSGGPGYRFNDENLKGATYPAGTVAMANAGPNTNGSQFFFVWKNTKLPPLYSPWGRVIGGMSVLRKIAAAGDDSQNGPGDGYPHRYTAFNRVQIVFSKRR